MAEGELPQEGLPALDGDGGDVYLALARRLAGSAAGVDSRAQSLEARFADARRSEDEADEVLVDGGWEDEPELPRARIPFPVRPAPVEVEALDDQPLFTSTGAAPAPVSTATNGKVVTLDELAQMVRRRKPRPRSVPEGQLALFAS
jgi:hypothetical protein